MEHKGKIGVYVDWIQDEGLEMVCGWARHGLFDKQIAENIGVSRRTFYNWMRDYPDFAKAIKQARIKPNIEIENAMFNLACGKTFVEEVKSILDPKTGQVVRIEKTRKQVPPSPALLIFLAKNRMRDRYKDYSPTPPESENTEEKQDVQIYLPNNGREENSVA